MELLINAGIISVIGMGFVFIFLSLQVLISGWGGKVAGKFAYLLPEPVKVTKRPGAAKPAAPTQANEGEVIAVISAAVQKFTAP